MSERSAIQNHEQNTPMEETSNIVPNIDLSMPVDRRRQSIEGSIIMTENNNALSANLNISANGPHSTTDHEYDSGKRRKLVINYNTLQIF